MRELDRRVELDGAGYHVKAVIQLDLAVGMCCQFYAESKGGENEREHDRKFKGVGCTVFFGAKP